MPKPTSTSIVPNPAEPSEPAQPDDNFFPELPTETEIYILPGGEVIVADMPLELAVRLVDNAHATGNDARRG